MLLKRKQWQLKHIQFQNEQKLGGMRFRNSGAWNIPCTVYMTTQFLVCKKIRKVFPSVVLPPNPAGKRDENHKRFSESCRLPLHFWLRPQGPCRVGTGESGLVMSSAGIQKLFCGIYSAFKCSFDEFVGEKVFSPSYSSAILAPPWESVNCSVMSHCLWPHGL